MKKYLVSVPVLARAEVYVNASSESEARELAYFKALNNKKDINEETIDPIYFDDTIENIENNLIEFAISDGYQIYDCKEEFGE